ncbi:helix-turn-helix domain-containing protein [Solidesulfovibrio sp.]
MKNAKPNSKTLPTKPDRLDLQDLSLRIRSAIDKLGIEKREFAEAGGITAQTLSGYLAAVREPSFSVLCGWIRSFQLDGNWLLTGQGEMFSASTNQKPNDLPLDEISEKLTPEQRNMLTYKRLQTELGTSKERIADGIDAIVMGKRHGARKHSKESGFGEDVGFSERGGEGIGDEAGV